MSERINAFRWFVAAALSVIVVASLCGCEGPRLKGHVLCTQFAGLCVHELALRDCKDRIVCDARRTVNSADDLGDAVYDGTRGAYYIVDGGLRAIVRCKAGGSASDVIYRWESDQPPPDADFKGWDYLSELQSAANFAIGVGLDVTCDGTWLIFSARGAGLYLWRIDEGKPRLLLAEGGDPVQLVRCTRRGVFVGRSSGLYSLDPDRGEVRLLLGPMGLIKDVSPAGTYVLSQAVRNGPFDLRRVDGQPLGKGFDVYGFNAEVRSRLGGHWPEPLFVGDARVVYFGWRSFGWTSLDDDGLLTYDFKTGKNHALPQLQTAGLHLARYYGPEVNPPQ